METDTILLVDDEKNVLEALKRAFYDDPWTVLTASNASDAFTLLLRYPIKVIISDEQMPGVAGSALLALVRERFPSAIRIMLTGHASIDAAMRAINDGEIYRFLTKPWDNNELRIIVRTALEKYNLEEENRRLLALVRQQAVEMKLLERQFPGISKLERDESGQIVVPEISEEELQQIVEQCQREYA
ncbi:MAG TPA: response regulator [Dissulfurispiraceae bacterium]|nr:response regulator [Dissulfurispiraceae bacterium]